MSIFTNWPRMDVRGQLVKMDMTLEPLGMNIFRTQIQTDKI